MNRNKDDAFGRINEQTDCNAIKKEPDSDDDEGLVCRLCMSKKSVQYVLGEGELHQLISNYLSIVVSNKVFWMA